MTSTLSRRSSAYLKGFYWFRFSAVIEGRTQGPPCIALTGRLLGSDKARLVDAGFQKFWRTSGDRETPALAEHLGNLHAFQEDLREALGLISRYNTLLISRNSLCSVTPIS